jgi:5-formyltetrahydrofolate cyclo-ligase
LFPKYTNRAVYITLSDEVATQKIIETIVSSDKKCFLPIQQGDSFFFTEITQETQYAKNKYGILEPIRPQQSKHKPDAILVP